MELANSRAENHPNIFRKKQGHEWCKFQKLVILAGVSREFLEK